MELQPLVLINAVGLTRKLLEHAPRLKQLAGSGWIRSLEESLPAVTCTAQASILTGRLPQIMASSATAGCFAIRERFGSGSSRTP